MRKRILSLLLAACMLLILPLPRAYAAQSGSCGSGLTWKLSGGVLTISGTGDMEDYQEGTAPWYAYRQQVTSLVVAEGVTGIGEYAFSYMEAIEEASMPKSLKTLGSNAFDYCSGMQTLKIADLAAWCAVETDGMSSVPQNWRQCELYVAGERVTNLEIPEGATVLGRNISNILGLTQVIVPGTVTQVNSGAFESYDTLQHVIFLGDAPTFGGLPFQGTVTTVFYPGDNATWTEENRNQVEGDITWIPYESAGGFGIIHQPEDQKLEKGTNAIFSVAAVGSKLSYRWQVCPAGSTTWTNLTVTGADTPTLSVQVSQQTNGNSYRCVVTAGTGATVTSRAAKLSLDTTVCYAYTPDLTADNFRYLQEIYTEKYPQLGLEPAYGDPEDRAFLLQLAKVITQGCTTDKEKADAISGWISRNLVYDENAPVLPMDAFYSRTGSCLTYGIFMQELLRHLGIPAVMGDGWRGDMEQNTPKQLFGFAGHAWCFAYVEGQWMLYDPLWQEATADQALISKWYYCATIDAITPVYEGSAFPPMKYNRSNCYIDGRFVGCLDGEVSQFGGVTRVLNWSLFFNISVFGEGTYDSYQDPGRTTGDMIFGELFTDDWLAEGSLVHARANGIHAAATTMEYGGKLYYLDGQTSHGFQVLAQPEEYSLVDGLFTVKTGYQGKPLETTGSWERPNACRVVWQSSNPQVASVDDNGVITTHAEGDTTISAHFYDKETGVYYGSGSVYVLLVSDRVFAPDYTDLQTGHDHSYILLTPELSEEAQIFTCSRADCAMSYVGKGNEPEQAPPQETTPEETVSPFLDVPQNKFYYTPVLWAVEKGITNGTSANEFSPDAPCTRKQIVTFLWRANGCPEPASMENPFTDVKHDRFEKAILWAYYEGITAGTSKTEFSPDKPCTRKQIVTFLWRANGKPEPVTTTNPFTDVKADQFEKAILWAYENGITTGKTATTFQPEATCTRGQIVTFLYRDMEE